MNRRTVLQMLGAGAAAALTFRRSLFAAGPATAAATSDEFFIFIHALGGWDVTLWSDPRNQHIGLIDPPATGNTDVGAMKLWKNVPVDGGGNSFEILAPSNVPMRFGPGIGELYDFRDRFTLINGLSMNTVSHPDGIAYSATGRHLQGGRPPASSIDVAIANELGTGQLIPDIGVRFPSWYVGDQLDRRAVPLRVTNAASIAKALARGDSYLHGGDREAITAVLADEAHTLAQRSNNPDPYDRLATQVGAEQKLIDDKLATVFTQDALKAAHPMFDFKTPSISEGALAAAFALEAMQRNLVRCVGLSLGTLDTHTTNYREHGKMLVDLFGVLATLVKQLDAIPHPSKPSAKLSEHTHIYVFSDFCRTPHINLTGGRDHYPNNSALVLSPRFVPGRVFGKTDAEQLLPAAADVKLSDGPRPLTPPDLMATFLYAFGVNPAPYVRDGEVVSEMLKPT